VTAADVLCALLFAFHLAGTARAIRALVRGPNPR
jgi:hypothetical protein